MRLELGACSRWGADQRRPARGEVPQLGPNPEGGPDQLDRAMPATVDLASVGQGVPGGSKGSPDVTTLVGHENNPRRWLGANGKGHDLENQASLRTRQRCSASRPKDDLRLQEQPEAREERAERLLKAMIAAPQHERVSLARPRRPRARTGYERTDQIGYHVVRRRRIADGTIPPDAVEVPASFSAALEISGVHEIGDDRLHRAGGKAHSVRDLAQTQVGPPGERQEDVPVC